MTNEIKISLLTGLSALLGSIIGAGSILFVNWMNLDAEMNKINVDTVVQEKIIFQKKSEEFFGNMSDMISFFNMNHTYDKKEASRIIGQTRKSALKILPYTSKEMAMNFLVSVELTQLAIDNSNPKEIKESMKLMQKSIAEMTKYFYVEMNKYKTKIDKLTSD